MGDRAEETQRRLIAPFIAFQVNKVAGYKASDVRRLLKDENIIRNRLKIKAIIENARRIRKLRKSHKCFVRWIALHHPLTKADWVKLFREQFLFTGGEIVGEFLMSIGYLPTRIIRAALFIKLSQNISRHG